MDSFIQLFKYFDIYSELSSTKKPPSAAVKGEVDEVQEKKTSGRRKSEIIEDRKRLIGSKCQTFFSKDPIVVQQATMQYLFDENGRKFLDCISNVQHVGHCHPKVVQMIYQQMMTSTCNLRFLSSTLTEAAQEILKTLPSSIDTILFCNSGSEANDLAIQLARDWTGRTDVIVLENAYHGHITTAMEMSPYKFDHGSSIKKPEWVTVVSTPDIYRGKFRLEDNELENREKEAIVGKKYSDEVAETLKGAAARDRKIAAYIAEAFQSCGGQILPPPGYFKDVASHIHSHGGLMIIDEVQTGFGRVGSEFWAHELHNHANSAFVPDIITMGKPMGNGFPVAAVATRREIADSHCGSSEYFNTYGGNPVACAAVLGVFHVLKEENMLDHSNRMGQLFESALRSLHSKHECIGHIRGVGMFWGVDLVRNRTSRDPDTELASKVVLKLRQEYNVLLSADGPHSNVLKFKPPLCFNKEDLNIAIDALDKALDALTKPQ